MSHIPDDYMFCCHNCEGALDYQYQDQHYAYYKCESCGKIREDELPDELKRESFILVTAEGTVARVTGNPDMSEKTKQMLQTLIEVAYKTPLEELEKRNEAN